MAILTMGGHCPSAAKEPTKLSPRLVIARRDQAVQKIGEPRYRLGQRLRDDLVAPLVSWEHLRAAVAPIRNRR